MYKARTKGAKDIKKRKKKTVKIFIGDRKELDKLYADMEGAKRAFDEGELRRWGYK